MKQHQTQTRQNPLLFVSRNIFVLALLFLPLVTLAATNTLPSSSELRAPAEEPIAADLAVAPETASNAFAPEQLEQLVAPIALYPDALLAQILMASTYPLEIVEADRWMRDQPELEGEALNQALLEKDWDPSVESLTSLPSVLKQMSENLDWTQDLGDAFLAQKNDLMDTVQLMRAKAHAEGNLVSTEQQMVTQQEDEIIVIESTSTEVVYVPTYSSTVVYGSSWGYPSYYYPAYYYPPPAGYGLISFGVGVIVGGAIWGNCSWGWGNNDIHIDIDRHNDFNRNTNNNYDRDRVNSSQGNRGSGGTSSWQHDASHRKGVNYPSSDVAQKFGASSGSNRVTSNEARGRSSASATNRGGTGASSRDRNSMPSNPAASATDRNRSSSSASRSPSASDRSSGSSAMSGSRSPSTDRMSSSRGAQSRGTTSYGGARGGMSRGGGRRR